MYGLIGYPLSHSFSKDFFTRLFAEDNIKNAEYRNFPLTDIQEFSNLIDSNPNLQGLNVTIPYKEKIVSFLDEIDPEAREIGAVNTICFDYAVNKRKLKGYNTDVYGFSRSLREILTDNHQISNALILGTGGASKAVAFSLKQMNISFEFVSSSSKSDLNYDNLTREIIQGCQLIVNTSPIGTYPKIEECPAIPYNFLTPSHILFDLVYNPAFTLFLRKGKDYGARVSNGLKMLEYQALKSWEIWNEGVMSYKL
jgi:shikimate dehydrogenase